MGVALETQADADPPLSCRCEQNGRESAPDSSLDAFPDSSLDAFRIRPARLREGRWGDDDVMGQRRMGCIAEVRPPHSRSMQVKAAYHK